MTPENFAYWLNGFAEMNGGAMPTAAQWKAIQDHLALVFKKVTPPVGETKIKVNVDTEGAQKSIDDLKKAYDELTKKAQEAPPWPFVPTSPNWWTPGHIYPGTIIWSTDHVSTSVDPNSVRLC